MGRFRFLKSLEIIPEKSNLSFSSNSLKSTTIFIAKGQTLILNSTPSSKISPWSLSNHLNSYRSVHVTSDETQVSIDTEKKDPPNAQIERICKIVLTNTANVESSLHVASIEVSPTLVLEVLKRLSNAGVLALSFFRWAEKQKGFKYSTESYNALIESLGKVKQFKLIWDLVSEMKRKRLLTNDTFALISRRYARARRVNEAIDAFEKMDKFGLKQELPDFNRLIDTLCKSRHVERAQEVFDKMKKRRFDPDIKSYTILLEGWGQQKNLLSMNEVYREMKDDGFEPDVVSYGIMINAHCSAKRYDEAVELFREMEATNCKPSPHIFCTLINGLGSEKRLSEALQFFGQSKKRGFEPEAPTYNAVVGAYCWSMRINDAYRMMDEMRKCGIGPNSRTYDIVLHHLIKAGRTEEAYSVFKRMSRKPGTEPTVSTYEIVVRMFCYNAQVDMAMRIWDEMKARGVLPVMHMYSTLINSLCHEDKLDDACKYFQEMLDIGIRPPGQLFSNLKQALRDEGMEETAVVLAQKIDKLRKTPLVDRGQ